ncbi:hypothetical protein ACFLSJ_04275 [Verrucomicrobiota bacterium]
MTNRTLVCVLGLLLLAMLLVGQPCEAGLWDTAYDLGEGWRWTEWFGFFHAAHEPWIYHAEHGWMWCLGDSPESVWIWTEDMGWLWTGGTVYPFLWRARGSVWVWYARNTDPRRFWNLDDLAWERPDGASKLEIPVTGSLQNPAWSPDGQRILFTRFRNGYNAEPADLMIFDLSNETVRELVADGSGNVNLPGSSWNAVTRKIAFSSSREPHDEIHLISDQGGPGDELRITSRTNEVAYEPTLSSNGEWIVFESHLLDVETDGVIMKRRSDGTGPYIPLTGGQDDCRQPNWSPDDARIVYQRLDGGQWDLWCMSTDGGGPTNVTAGLGDKTDASFAPDGRRIVFSSDLGVLVGANLFWISVTGGASTRITFSGGYDGAASWSPDGGRIVFESCPVADPDGSLGTELWVIRVHP